MNLAHSLKEILDLYIYNPHSCPANLAQLFRFSLSFKFNDKIKVNTITVIILAQTSIEKKIDNSFVRNNTLSFWDCQKDICSHWKKITKEKRKVNFPWNN